MVVVPWAIAETTPEAAPIVAVAVVTLLHVPPGTASSNDKVLPAQTGALPVIAAGGIFTVTVAVACVPQPLL